MCAPAPRILDDLSVVPKDAACILLVRHADRDGPTDRLIGDDIDLNAVGRRRARLLGEGLRGRPMGKLHSSPAMRCVTTCRSVIEGYGAGAPVAVSSFLGLGGPAIIRPKRAAELMTSLGLVPFVEAYVRGELDPSIVMPCSEGTSRLFSWAACKMRTSRAGVSVGVSHDLVLTPMLVQLFGYDIGKKGLIGFLDGVVLYEKGRRVLARFGGKESDVTAISSVGYD
jgi:hypothetical protein